MTKKEIVKLISDRGELSQLRAKELVQWTFNAIIEALETDGRIELRNFGVFEVKIRKARVARNPKTDEEVYVPEKRVVTFQPGKIMEERVRKSETLTRRKKGRKLADDDTEEMTAGVPVGVPARAAEARHDDGFSAGETAPRKPR